VARVSRKFHGFAGRVFVNLMNGETGMDDHVFAGLGVFHEEHTYFALVPGMIHQAHAVFSDFKD
jgi:hypothetical protein